jgi:hypothetical protein
VPSEDELVFNIVVTGDVFAHLKYFIASLIGESSARFRLVVNACTPESVELMHAFAADHADRVTDVVEVSRDTMVGHGKALDLLMEQRHDGDWFCFVDADIEARSAWLAPFCQLLGRYDVVSSGKEVWTDDNVVDKAHLGFGLGGRHFYHPDGFVYGCPHLAMYRREALDDTQRRWGVVFGQRGDDLSDAMTARLDEAGHLYKAYDTAKVVNILLQLDGHTLIHEENPELVHIGGLSHFLAPPEWDKRSGPDGEPDWTTTTGIEARAAVARYTASVLRALTVGEPAPAVPAGLPAGIDQRVRFVRGELIDMMERYGSW